MEEIIQFKRLDPDAIIPVRATPFSAAFDLFSLEDIHIDPFAGNTLVKTGVAVQMPEGTYGRIAMRSGLAVKHHLFVSAGVIDLDYTGPIGVVVGCSKINNFGTEERPVGYTIKKGERFAQLVIERACYAPGVEVKEFERVYGSHEGFGSTGR